MWCEPIPNGSSTLEAGVAAQRINAGTVQEVTALLQRQGYVSNTDGQFYLLPAMNSAIIAVYRKDPNDGCTLPPPISTVGAVEKGNIQSPCQGTVYDGRTGIVLKGAVGRPLDWMPVTIANGMVMVDTGRIMVRARYEQNQAVELPSVP